MRKLIFCLLMLCGAGISNGTASYPKPGGISVFTLDPAASSISWKAEKPTGTHNGTIRIRSGSITLRCGQLASGSVLMDMNSIVVTDLTAPDKQKLENNLKGNNFFDAGKFPLARLDITSASYKQGLGNRSATVSANLLLHGITQKITFTADITKNQGDQFAAQADIVINRRDWAIATKNLKYDTFIYKDIHLHVLLQGTREKTANNFVMKRFIILIFAIITGALVLAYKGKGPAFKGNIITLKVGKTPTSVEVVDLNNDKIPDLVVANGDDSSVTVLLGKGKGIFRESEGSPFYAGTAPNDVVIADFNKDGKPDLAFANHTKKYLTVLVGDEQGGFKPLKGSPFAVNVIPHTHGVATGDFNKDGNLDLVTDSWGNDRIEILFGNNNHGFDQPGMIVQVGKHPYQRIRTADLNRDGKMDIVTTNLDGNNCIVLLGNGKGGFHQPPGSPFACGDSPFGIAIGDINGDGKLDMAIVNSPTITSGNTGKDGLTILTGDGAGRFSMMLGSPFKTGKSPSRAATGDINGDGVNDVAVTNYNDNSITVFLMGKNTVASSYAIRVGQKPDGIAIADIDGDNKNDILVTNSLDNTLMIIKPGK